MGLTQLPIFAEQLSQIMEEAFGSMGVAGKTKVQAIAATSAIRSSRCQARRLPRWLRWVG
jgi:hypothetical protein